MDAQQQPTKPLCETCGVNFSNNSYLKTHVKIVHEKLRQFKCKYCEKLFSVKFSLNRHINQVHSKQKPYSCRHCSQAFSDYTTRFKHERAVHSQSRPFKCICGKAFSYSNVLKAHLKTHSNEQKFTCAICNHSFSQKHNLQTHLKNVHLFKRHNKAQTPLKPLYIDTNLPAPIMPSTGAFIQPTFLPLEIHQSSHVINLTGFTLMNPNQILSILSNPINFMGKHTSSQPLKVVFANI